MNLVPEVCHYLRHYGKGASAWVKQLITGKLLFRQDIIRINIMSTFDAPQVKKVKTAVLGEISLFLQINFELRE